MSMYRFALIFFILCGLASAEERLFDNLFSRTNDCVNLQTGSLNLFKTDMTINAVEPIVIQRSYAGGDGLDPRGGWAFFSYLQICIRFKEKLLVVDVAESSGAMVRYVSHGQHSHNTIQFLPEISDRTLGTVNTASGMISGRTNLKNNRLSINFKHQMAELVSGDGSRRIYRKLDFAKEDLIGFHLVEEVRANGNVVLYSYDAECRLAGIKTLNPSRTKTYAWVKLTYKGLHDFTIAGSNGCSLQYVFEEKNGIYQLSAVTSNFGYGEEYCYEPGYSKVPNKKHWDKDRGYLLSGVFVKGRPRLAVQYYRPGDNLLPSGENITVAHPKEGASDRVSAIFEPSGEEGKLIAAHTYYHYPNKRQEEGFREPCYTEVKDCDGNLCRHHYSGHLRPLQVEYFDQDKLYCRQRFVWKEGEIQTKILEDGEGQMRAAKQFCYDGRGNVIKETLIHPDGEYNKYYRYSEDGFNLTLYEEEEGGTITYFRYKPGTNLLTAKFVGDKKRIYRRRFYEYNEDNICVREIEDNGSSLNMDDFGAVTERRIREICLNEQNFPLMIKERYYDPKRDEERLLRKVCYLYNDRNQIARQDIYDAKNVYRNAICFEYDAVGRLLKKSDLEGDAVQYEYDAFGNQTGAESSASLKKITYDYAGRPVSSEENGRKSYFQYDNKGNIVSAIDPYGNVLRYQYDAFGRPVKTVFPLVRTIDGGNIAPVVHTAYDILGNQVSIQNAKGDTTRMKYNIFKKQVRVENPDGSVVTNRYFPDGSLFESIAEDGSKTRYSYNAFKEVVKKEIYSPYNELLSTETWEYLGSRLKRHITPCGLITDYEYDGCARLQSEVQNGCRKAAYEYDALGFLLKKIIPDGNGNALVHITLRDQKGQVVEERKEDLFGRLFSRVLFSYDKCGNKSSEGHFLQAGLATEYFFYDENRRIVRRIDAGGNEMLSFYDDRHLNELGQLVTSITEIDPDGRITVTVQDALERKAVLIKKSPLKEVVFEENYFYDLAGNQTCRQTDILYHKKREGVSFVRWEYDSCNQPIKMIEENGDTERVSLYRYDSRKRKIAYIKPGGVSLEYIYDYLSRLAELRASDDSCHYVYQYDRGDRPVEIRDFINNNILKRRYNIFGEVEEEILPSAAKLRRTFDQMGRCSLLTLPDGSAVAYEYDPAYPKAIERLDAAGKKVWRHTYLRYDLDGNLLAWQMIGNAGEGTADYDSQGRLRGLMAPTLRQSVLSRSQAGLVLSVDSSLFKESAYSYDDCSQLTSEEGLIAHRYEYNSVGNCLVRDDQEQTFDALNQMAGHFEYDDCGNPVLRKDGNVRYQYDALDRLACAIFADQKICFTYDAFHRRVSCTVYKMKEGRFLKGERHYYLNDQKNEIGLQDDDNNIVELKISGVGLSSAVAVELHGQAYAPLHDLRHNIAALLDMESGQIAESYYYGAFGAELIFNGAKERQKESLLGNPWRFAAKRFESLLKMVFFGRRYFDVETSRFLTPDPAGFTDGANLYVFVMNNPLSKYDPDGLAAFDVSPRPDGLYIPLDVVFRGLMLCLKAIGIALDLLVYHLTLPLPILQDAMFCIGKLLKWDFSAQPEQNKYAHATNNSYGDLSHGSVIYVNGMMNKTAEDSAEAMAMIENKLDGRMASIQIHIPSRGLLYDMLELLALKLNLQTPNSRLLASHLKNIIEQSHGQMGNILGHSKGALLVRQAVKLLSPDERNLLTIHAFGPAALLSSRLAYEVHNYASPKDLIFFMSMPGLIRHALGGKSNLTFVPCGQGTLLMDHAFNGPSYMNATSQVLDHILSEQNARAWQDASPGI